MSNKTGYVYMLSNERNTTIYIGITSNLIRRVWEHKNSYVDSFTSRYHIKKLVYYEVVDDIRLAIDREKQLKGGSRKKKLDLINRFNPEWKDLFDTLII